MAVVETRERLESLEVRKKSFFKKTCGCLHKQGDWERKGRQKEVVGSFCSGGVSQERVVSS